MQLNAKETTITKSLLKIVKFVDGDGIILEDIVSKKNLKFVYMVLMHQK
jgi:hypothetical protein